MVSGITPCARECKWIVYFGETPKGTYKATSPGKPGLPSVFLPARRQCRVMTSQSASHGSARLSWRSGWVGLTAIETIAPCSVVPGQSPSVQWSCSFMIGSCGEIRVHTPSHIRKNSGFSTQDEPLVLLGLEALTETLNLRYATRSTFRPNALPFISSGAPQTKKLRVADAMVEAADPVLDCAPKLVAIDAETHHQNVHRCHGNEWEQ